MVKLTVNSTKCGPKRKNNAIYLEFPKGFRIFVIYKMNYYA